MMRPVRSSLAAVALVTVGSVLAGCGGPSPYCVTVEEQTATLEDFGKDRTNAAYTTYADALDALAEDAPESVASAWAELSEVTRGVLAAQEEVGLALEEMGDDDKVAELSTEQLADLNASYEAFNATEDQRDAVVKNVKQECDITLAS
ncbi:hypothetical protein ACHAAC_05625 [Aeromicrobium sp. CF4.19]|uniref:hypothetical protein n=1 Tax=Aeromicrobium sp. CF4.19 TaxID=3373082 RepID=UPI003EE74566